MSSLQILVLPAFGIDIDEVMDWTEQHFGVAAVDRYAALIEQAMTDLMKDPVRSGAKVLAGAGSDVCMYHLRLSRDLVMGEQVKQPRHFILYRHSILVVEFARLLHESRDVELHLPSEYRVT